MNENNALRRVRFDRAMELTLEIQKLSAYAQRKLSIPRSKLRKIQSYGLSLTAMKDDAKLRPIAEAYLKIIDLFGELRQSLDAGCDLESLRVGKEIEKLFNSVEEVVKNGI